MPIPLIVPACKRPTRLIALDSTSFHGAISPLSKYSSSCHYMKDKRYMKDGVPISKKCRIVFCFCTGARSLPQPNGIGAFLAFQVDTPSPIFLLRVRRRILSPPVVGAFALELPAASASFVWVESANHASTCINLADFGCCTCLSPQVPTRPCDLVGHSQSTGGQGNIHS